jgi:RNA polymerase sigma factor (sigma-70 family)
MGISVFEAIDAPLVDLIIEAQSVESNDTVAMNELVRRFEPLVRSVVGRLRPRPNNYDDLLNGARWGLVCAVRKHDGRTEGFTGYLIRYTRGEAFRALERTSTPDLLPGDEAFPEPPAAPAEPDLPDLPLHILTVDQRYLLRCYYWEDQTYAEIARCHGVSLSAVRQRMMTTHKVLRPLLVEAVAA